MSRKLLTRVIGAPILLVALLGILYVDYSAQRILAVRFLIAVACGIGMTEFLMLIRAKGYRVAWAPCLLLVVLPVLPWSWILNRPVPELFLPAAGLLLFSMLVQLVFRHPDFRPEGAGLCLLGFGYLSLLHLACINPRPVTEGTFVAYLLFIVVTNKGSDMAAFVVGKSIGRRKLSPKLSPGKTWEGSIGGAIVGTAAGYAVLRWSVLHGDFEGVPEWGLLSLSLLVTIAAQLGDLVESAFKRWAQVKDSGRLIPEFGGILDMMDSFLLSIPVAYVGCEALARIFK